jgi:hypothetical protein
VVRRISCREGARENFEEEAQGRRREIMTNIA